MFERVKVAGYCPMGCGETLAAEDDCGVYCVNAECPDQDAVGKILSDPEVDHLATFDEHKFTLAHPLRCRLLEGGLTSCEILHRIAGLDGPPVEPGRYRVTIHEPDGYSESYRSGDAGLDFEKLP